MKILSVDTSSSVCAVALLEDEELINQKILDNGKTHSENFMSLLDETLKETNISLDDIDLIVCCVGPGSFTGIRIGIASIKAIAEIKHIKIVSVTSLESLSYNVESVDKEDIISMIDARNNQVYAGIFDFNHEKKCEYLADDINVILDKILNLCSEKIIFVGDGAVFYKDLILEKLRGKDIKFIDDTLNKQNAVSLGKCGYRKFLKNEDIKDADTINPLYLRKSQAERMKNAK